MNTKIFFNFLLGITMTVFFTHCKQQPYKEEEVKDKITVATDVKLDLVIASFPSPSVLTNDIKASNLPLKKELMNVVSKSGSYTNNNKKAINLGIYFADLSYVAGYGQLQDANSYLSTVKQFAEGMGIGNAFDQSFYERFNKNLGNSDSMSVVMDEGYKNAKNYLQTNDRAAVASLMLAGGWVEGLYLATQTIGNSSKNDTNKMVYQRIGEQKFSLQSLMDLMDQLKSNQDVAALQQMMQDMQNTYSNLSPSALTQSQVAMIGEKVSALRNQLVN